MDLEFDALFPKDAEPSTLEAALEALKVSDSRLRVAINWINIFVGELPVGLKLELLRAGRRKGLSSTQSLEPLDSFKCKDGNGNRENPTSDGWMKGSPFTFDTQKNNFTGVRPEGQEINNKSKIHSTVELQNGEQVSGLSCQAGGSQPVILAHDLTQSEQQESTYQAQVNQMTIYKSQNLSDGESEFRNRIGNILHNTSGYSELSKHERQAKMKAYWTQLNAYQQKRWENFAHATKRNRAMGGSLTITPPSLPYSILLLVRRNSSILNQETDKK